MSFIFYLLSLAVSWSGFSYKGKHIYNLSCPIKLWTYMFFGDMSQKCLKIPTGFLHNKSFGNDLFSSPRFPFIQGTFKPFWTLVFVAQALGKPACFVASGEETLSTLNYAARAKTIRLNASLALDVSLDIARCGSVSKNPPKKKLREEKAFKGSKDLFCKYLEDLGCLGFMEVD